MKIIFIDYRIISEIQNFETKLSLANFYTCKVKDFKQHSLLINLIFDNVIKDALQSTRGKA